MQAHSFLFLVGLLFCVSRTFALKLSTEYSEDFPRDLEAEVDDLKKIVIALQRQIASVEDEAGLVRQRRQSANNQSSRLWPYNPDQCVCPPGAPGPMGMPGQQGVPGRDGRDGRDWNGCSAEPTPEPPILHGNATGGSVFIRWGRSECGPSSELLYSGTAAGSHYDHLGSGSNYLCMPDDPIYDHAQAGPQGGAYIYGAEYQTSSFNQWSHLHDSNPPCAVCRAPSRSSLLVIPARNVCPSSEWTTEYTGFMVASHYSHKKSSEFVCMDKNAEAIPRTTHNANGALFYVAESACGSGGSGLPCSPYVTDYEVTCAVCTR